jgi:metacaspase-1
MKGRTDEARNLYNYLVQIKHYHPRDIILLTDDQNGVFGQPTRKNILDAFAWLGEKAVPGERIVVYYSGHGRCVGQGKKRSSANNNSSKDRDGGRHGSGKGKDDRAMGEGETIYPVDFRSHARGMIAPEELEERLRPAQRKGAKLTVILDTHAAVS